jgi:hypothetical protein
MTEDILLEVNGYTRAREFPPFYEIRKLISELKIEH